MEYLLFAGYLFLFAWIVTKIKFFTNAGLSKPQVVILFLLKVMAGIFYGWVGIYYGESAMMVDTWGYHYLGLQEYKLLHTHPTEYFFNFFRAGTKDEFWNFLTARNSFWNDLKTRSVIKLLSIFNLFSVGNYYVNVIFYCFVSLFGPFFVFRVMRDVFTEKKTLLIIGIFLIPSFLFWTSGIHKEGLIFTSIGAIIYCCYFSFKTGRTKMKYAIVILLALFLLTVLRNFLLVILVPALIAWFSAIKFSTHPLRVFSICYLAFILLFFSAKKIDSRFDFPAIVVAKQREFLDMYGGSMVPVKELTPDGKSFLMALPQAVDLSILRPHPTDVIHLLSLAATIETDLLLLVFVLFIFYHKKERYNKQFIYFCLFFSFTTLLSIGYTVNFIGAIVRYRSIILPFLVTPLLVKIDFTRILKLVKR